MNGVARPKASVTSSEELLNLYTSKRYVNYPMLVRSVHRAMKGKTVSIERSATLQQDKRGIATIIHRIQSVVEWLIHSLRNLLSKKYRQKFIIAAKKVAADISSSKKGGAANNNRALRRLRTAAAKVLMARALTKGVDTLLSRASCDSVALAARCQRAEEGKKKAEEILDVSGRDLKIYQTAIEILEKKNKDLQNDLSAYDRMLQRLSEYRDQVGAGWASYYRSWYFDKGDILSVDRYFDFNDVDGGIVHWQEKLKECRQKIEDNETAVQRFITHKKPVEATFKANEELCRKHSHALKRNRLFLSSIHDDMKELIAVEERDRAILDLEKRSFDEIAKGKVETLDSSNKAAAAAANAHYKQLLKDLSERVCPQISALIEKYIHKCGCPSLVKEWQCQADGSFKLSLREKMALWLPRDKNADDEPKGGTVLTLGNEQKVVTGRLVANNLQIDDGFNAWAHKYTKLWTPLMKSLKLIDSETIEFKAMVKFKFIKREECIYKNFTSLQTSWNLGAEVVGDIKTFITSKYYEDKEAKK